jgi:hypothetical protein
MLLIALLYFGLVAVIITVPGYELPSNIQAGLELFGFAAVLLAFGTAEFEKIKEEVFGKQDSNPK